jgi:hypothetical protein
MTYLEISWLLGESCLAFANPRYKYQSQSNGVYGRMALRRSLLAETDRRGLMLHNKRAIAASPYLTNLVEGATEELHDEQLLKAKAKRAKVALRPKEPQEKVAYVLQFLYAARTADRELTPPDAVRLAASDSVVEICCRESDAGQSTVRSVQHNIWCHHSYWEDRRRR